MFVSRWWDEVRQDLVYAARTLRREPRLTAAAALTLALAVGAGTAIFSTADAALLRPLALPDADRLVAVYSVNKASGAYVSASYPDYQDFARRARSFEALSAYARFPLRLTRESGSELVPVEAVTANYFRMLGLPPLVGRAFREEDDTAPGPVPPAMISETLWRTEFGGGRDVPGRRITIQDQPFEVVGIVPARYTGLNLNWGEPPRIWISLSSAPLALPRLRAIDILHQRGMPWLLMAGRLREGVPVARAGAELGTVASDLARAWPATNRDLTAVAFEANRSKFWPAYRPLVSRSLAVFAGGAALMLLLACGTVANLLLARALGREREIAIRLSIGATRGRLIRQLLAESLLLAVPGLAGGLAVAEGLGRLLARFPNGLGIRLTLDPALDGRVLAFSAALALAAAVLFGLAPALRASRQNLRAAFEASAGHSARAWGRNGILRASVVAQVALSAVLVISGGLFGRTLQHAYSADLGFDASHLVAIGFNATGDAAESPQIERAFLRFREMAGVRGASTAMNLPLTGMRLASQVRDAGRAGEAAITLDTNRVGPGFFRAIGIPLAAGRDFSDDDVRPSARKAIVNQALAERLWPSENPVGRTLLVGRGASAERREVVGVSSNAKMRSVWDTPGPQLFVAAPVGQANYFVLRAEGPPASVIPEIRREWGDLAPRVPLDAVRAMDEQLSLALGPQRLAAALMAAFGALATVLAAAGIYGVMAYSVKGRTREIGIRIAIGAQRGTVVRQVVRQALALAATGLALGSAIAAAAVRVLASQLGDVSPYDAVAFSGAALLIAGVSMAVALPAALRASRIDPTEALRCD